MTKKLSIKKLQTNLTNTYCDSDIEIIAPLHLKKGGNSI